jgi:hypothetical protein
LQGQDRVQCFHTRDGLIIRVDEHHGFLGVLEELALKHKSGRKTNIQETRNGAFDRLLSMFWPGDAKDVEIISSPLSENLPSPEFNYTR